MLRFSLSHLVNLSLLLLNRRGQGGGGWSSLRRMTQPEVGVTEVSVALDVMKRLPDQTLLLQETLICHQQVQVTLRGGMRAGVRQGIRVGQLENTLCHCVGFHLVLDHGAEVVVSEEHRDLSLFGCRVEFTQTVIRQLSRCRLQELLRHQTWTHTHQ